MMDNALEYKGYHGSVEYSASDKCLHGKVLGIRALVTYEGIDAVSIEAAFRASVDDYLALCEEGSLTPEREYSGLFQVRVPSETHRDLVLRAEASGKKLNAIVGEALERYLKNAAAL
ncbi:MAG: type II toxin-antitoxin system HicB family antitoxin [Coriobacteriales bacterium]|jgi:predicted HicB family RNase H-like nuclease|nr:type II toxin-antitoxin system HicB family antitoxin [Coriobacteriales bacterium]